MEVMGRGDEDFSLVELHAPGFVTNTCMRTGNASARSNVAVVDAIEDLDVVRVRHRQQIFHGIHRQSNDVSQTRVRPPDNPRRRGVAVRVPGKDIDALSRQARYQNLAVSQVKADGMRRHQLGARSEEHTSELQSLTNLVCRL